MNCKDVLRAIRTGDRVRIDGSRGVVELVNRT
ncbi:MAG: hypothetical protein R3F14_27770 [Polyangiaceae bacterium]